MPPALPGPADAADTIAAMPPDPARAARSLVELLALRAAAQPDEVAYTYLDQGEEPADALTYGALEQRARAIGAHLGATLPPGSRVLLIFPNQLDFLPAFFGCHFAGMIAVPMPPPRTAQAVGRLLHVAARAGTRVALCSPDLREELERRLAAAADADLDLIFADRIPAAADPAWRPAAPAGEDIAVLQFTSGSTGNPKGVCVTHANILHNCTLLESVCGSAPDLKLVSWLPNFHDWGLVGCLMFPLFVGRPSFVFDPAAFLFRPRRWLEAISRVRGTISCAPNFAYETCIRAATRDDGPPLDLGCWRMALVGAEPVRKDTVERFAAAFGPSGFKADAFFPCYGLAESTLIVSGGRPNAPPVCLRADRAALEDRRVRVLADATGPEARDLVGCGRSLLDHRIVIADPRTGERCDPDEVGEVWVSGGSVARGYWDDPELSQATFGARIPGELGGPYLRTGDLGFLLDGELFICGRLKDVIIKAGQNYFAEDIEHSVERAHSALRPNCCAAFGVEAGGAERLVIVQELDYGRKADAQAVIGNIQMAVSKQHDVMADAIVLIRPGSLEKTGSGKVRRQTTRTLFLDAALPVLAAWQSW
ncbi:MAG: fatty acyl-AMP ligase [Proteobacteria bacterium]|nr:fatty acyl-AMP ligase [Pseudomonadota bacterium]